MKPSKKAIDTIKMFESLKLTSYKCLATEKLYTVGYGHYGVNPNLTITEEQAESYLLNDISQAKAEVDRYHLHYSFNQNQYDALISFAFNVGSISQLTARGVRTKDEIGESILLYNKSKGVTVRGLTKRRKVEHDLYCTEITGELKDYNEIAKEVVQGKWGNGQERIRKLRDAGYNFHDVQVAVNSLTKK